MVELLLPKQTARVRFPSSAQRMLQFFPHAPLAQSVERFHGKEKVSSSILLGGSISFYGQAHCIHGAPGRSVLVAGTTGNTCQYNCRTHGGHTGETYLHHV